MAWNFYVHHYKTNEGRDEKKYVDGKGILYPRAGTLGGCTAHNAMITVVPHDSDWDDIAHRTNDETWHADYMWRYWQRVERCQYRHQPRPGEHDPSGHGFEGWLATSKVDPGIALGDKNVAGMLLATLRQAARRLPHREFFSRLLRWLRTRNDPNDERYKAAFEGVITTTERASSSAACRTCVPIASSCG